MVATGVLVAGRSRDVGGRRRREGGRGGEVEREERMTCGARGLPRQQKVISSKKQRQNHKYNKGQKCLFTQHLTPLLTASYGVGANPNFRFKKQG